MAAAAEAKPQKTKAVPVKVMTRNLFLGADLSPALNSTGFESFIEANGAILREVDLTDFPRRARGLAGEIAATKPDLVGLQEVAHWRTGPVAVPPAVSGNPPTALTTEYDFLQMLLAELDARGLSYRAAVVKEEFDFEAPADENNVDNDAPPGPFNDDPSTNDESPNSLDDAELNGRLTMRDVILVNEDSKVKAKVSKPQTGSFQNLYRPTVSGIEIPVTRGFTAADVTVKKGKGRKLVKKTFRFVNSHFEAFDDETQRPSIRAQQAQELLNGPAKGTGKAKTVILLGDFNSDVPGVQPGDEQAYQTLLDGGFSERSLDQPISCCVSNLFTAPASEFDHQVDHVMTNASKKRVKLVSSQVTGLEQVNGIYSSDHAGVFSKLKLR
jgi:endonuclease/exonuclease/phosphatase family metal-dependent hydrolase